MQEQITIGALRFQFLPDEQGWRFDTIPFYLHYVKDFLLANEGEVIWVRGRLVERNAYLIFRSSIEDEVTDLLRRALHDLKRVKITVVERPWELFYECMKKERAFEGCLELGGQKIGEPKKQIEKDAIELAYQKYLEDVKRRVAEKMGWNCLKEAP